MSPEPRIGLLRNEIVFLNMWVKDGLGMRLLLLWFFEL